MKINRSQIREALDQLPIEEILLGNKAESKTLTHKQKAFAEEIAKGATKAQIALAWILSQNDEITAIPGTRKIHRLEENLGAYQVVLNQVDMELIEVSLPKITVGNRY
jgi:aryl-alcohol dehydrogenase-like predicted oxidoreductase